jgi:ankyrin repeat protein
MAPASLAATNQKANSDLQEAVKAGDESKVVAALAQPGVDVNCCDEEFYGYTPLLLACNPGDRILNRSVVRLLLQDSRVNVDARDIQGQTALHSWRAENPLEEILLSKRTDIDLNAADVIGQTPLLWFARNGFEESVRRLIGVESVNLFATTIDLFTALHQVAERKSPFPDWWEPGDISNRCNIVHLVLEAVGRRGHNVVSFVDATDILNRSALHYIAEEGCIEILEVLCKYSPDMNVNGVDFHGCTPLHLAVQNGHDAVVKRLLQLQSIDANVGATVIASDPDNLKPFRTNPDHLDICRPNLLSKRPREQSSRDLTPLHFAVMDGRREVVRLLLEWEGINGERINIDAVDSAGLTPLQYSVQNGHSEMVECLLNEGQPVATLNYDKQCGVFEDLLHLATALGEKTIAIQLLKTLGSRMNDFQNDISTRFTSNQSLSNQSRLLASAAVSNHFEIIKYIVKWLPEVNVNETSVWAGIPGLVATPLHFAVVERDVVTVVEGGVATVVEGDVATVVEGDVATVAKRGHVEAVQELLEHPKLDVNAQDDKKMTPLLYAIDAGNVDMVKVLCQKDKFHRLRATEENSAGHTPLQIVVEDNNRSEDPNMKAIEKVLLERPEVKDFVDRLYRDRQVFVDAANALLVGAALIASVTFAGWLQPPLGYTPYYDFSQPFPAPPGAYESYAAIKQNPKVKAFWVFNSLSFFFAIATVLAGADAAMPSLDDAFIGRVVKSVRRALIVASILLVMSVVCVLGAFASGGFAVLPPVLKYDTSMIITVFVGGTVCMIILAKFLWKLAKAMRIRLLKRAMKHCMSVEGQCSPTCIGNGS